VKVILQLAESGSFFGQVDLFKVRGKFALSDAYEDHFLLPKGKILVVTHHRVMLLQVSWPEYKNFVVLPRYHLLPHPRTLTKSNYLLFFHVQQPSNIIAQRKFSPARDPCSVLWDVLLDDLVTMELTHGKKDHQNPPPSRLILYLQARSTESKEQIRVIKCSPETKQSLEVYISIEQAMNTYGSNLSKVGF
jgi:vacuolar protein sorting-associated protein 13A/C